MCEMNTSITANARTPSRPSIRFKREANNSVPARLAELFMISDSQKLHHAVTAMCEPILVRRLNVQFDTTYEVAP